MFGLYDGGCDAHPGVTFCAITEDQRHLSYDAAADGALDEWWTANGLTGDPARNAALHIVYREG